MDRGFKSLTPHVQYIYYGPTFLCMHGDGEDVSKCVTYYERAFECAGSDLIQVTDIAPDPDEVWKTDEDQSTD